MADYDALISHAVASLDRNTAAARSDLYRRARAMLLERLRGSEPPWSDDQIAGELAALDAAIGRVEAAVAQAAGTMRKRPAALRRASPQPPGRGHGGERAEAKPSALLPRPFAASPRLIGAFGAVVLALVAAASYVHLSRPGAPAPAQTARADSGNKAASSRAGSHATAAGAADQANAGEAADIVKAALPYGMGRQFVFYRSAYSPGTIVISTAQHKLYQIKGETVAIQYSIGVGQTCVNAAGMHRIAAKQEWPAWPPAPGNAAPMQTASIAAEHRAESRLGARALFLNDLDYGIHGTARPNVIGQNSSFGCFMLIDDDVTDLYSRTPVDTPVIITN